MKHLHRLPFTLNINNCIVELLLLIISSLLNYPVFTRIMMSLFTSPSVRNGEIFNLKIMGNYESFYNLDISLVTPTPLQNNISIASEEMCLVYIEIDVCIICQHNYRRISGNMRFFFYDQTWESHQILCFLWPSTLKIYLFYRTLLCKINLWLQISCIWSVLTNAFKIWRHKHYQNI